MKDNSVMVLSFCQRDTCALVPSPLRGGQGDRLSAPPSTRHGRARPGHLDRWGAALFRIGITGTRPVMTREEEAWGLSITYELRLSDPRPQSLPARGREE